MVVLFLSSYSPWEFGDFFFNVCLREKDFFRGLLIIYPPPPSIPEPLNISNWAQISQQRGCDTAANPHLHWHPDIKRGYNSNKKEWCQTWGRTVLSTWWLNQEVGWLLSLRGSEQGGKEHACLEPPSSPKIPVCLYGVVAGVLSLRMTATEIQSIPQPPHYQRSIYTQTQGQLSGLPWHAHLIGSGLWSACHLGSEESLKGQHLMPNDRPEQKPSSRG